MGSEREASAARTTTIFTTWPNPNSDQIPARSFPQGRLTQSRVGAVRANLQMPSVRLYVRTGRHLRRLHKILWDSWRASLPPACAGFLYGFRPPVRPITKISDTLHLGTFICRLVPGVHALTYESMRRWVEVKKKKQWKHMRIRFRECRCCQQ